MANLRPGEDYLLATGQSNPSHEIEEQFSCPKISKVWSINNPKDELEPVPVDPEMQPRPPPHPPLRFKVQLPSRPTFFKNGVHDLELVLQYGDTEEQVLMIDLHRPMKFPTQKYQRLEIVTNSTTTNDHSIPASPTLPSPENIEDIEESINPPPPKSGILTKRSSRQQESQSCHLCNKKFYNKHILAEHLLLHSNPKKKKAGTRGWKNDGYFCSKGFPDRHLLVRRKAHPFGKHFSQKGISINHLRLQNSATRHPFHCEECGKSFTTKGNLTTHVRLHDSNPATRRPFHCDQCDRSFTEKVNLTTHVTTVHLRLKQFQCPQCDRKFGQKSNLTKHLNNIHLGMRYPCRRPHCDKSFSKIGTLRQHEKRAH